MDRVIFRNQKDKVGLFRMCPTMVQRISRAEEKREYAFMDPILVRDVILVRVDSQ